MKNFLSGKRLEKFLAIQNFLVPRSRGFSEEQKSESVRIINEFIETKPNIIAYKIVLFLVLIDVFSLLFHFKMFMSLSERNKNEMMDFFFNNKISLFRKGFWGINTLTKLGVYSQPSIYPDIGYEIGELHE